MFGSYCLSSFLSADRGESPPGSGGWRAAEITGFPSGCCRFFLGRNSQRRWSFSTGNMATELGSGGEPGEVSASGRLRGLPVCSRHIAGWLGCCSGAVWRTELSSRGLDPASPELASVSTEGRNPFACGCSDEDWYSVALLVFAIVNNNIKATF